MYYFVMYNISTIFCHKVMGPGTSSELSKNWYIFPMGCCTFSIIWLYVHLYISKATTYEYQWIWITENCSCLLTASSEQQSFFFPLFVCHSEYTGCPATTRVVVLYNHPLIYIFLYSMVSFKAKTLTVLWYINIYKKPCVNFFTCQFDQTSNL